MKTPGQGNDGFTVIEIIVGIFIFSTISSLMLYTIRSADKIGGRGAVSHYAATLGASEAERIGSIAETNTFPNDTTYTQTVRGVEFDVRRTVNVAQVLSAEVKIEIIPAHPHFPSYIFKIYQGIR